MPENHADKDRATPSMERPTRSYRERHRQCALTARISASLSVNDETVRQPHPQPMHTLLDAPHRSVFKRATNWSPASTGVRSTATMRMITTMPWPPRLPTVAHQPWRRLRPTPSRLHLDPPRTPAGCARCALQHRDLHRWDQLVRARPRPVRPVDQTLQAAHLQPGAVRRKPTLLRDAARLHPRRPRSRQRCLRLSEASTSLP